MAVYRSKYSYQQEPRTQTTTTVNLELYNKFIELSCKINQPKTKMWDIALKQIFESEDSLNEFIQKVKEY